MKRTISIFLFPLLLSLVACNRPTIGVADYRVIPAFDRVESLPGSCFVLNERTAIRVVDEGMREAEFLRDAIGQQVGLCLAIGESEGAPIVLEVAPDLAPEAYEIVVQPEAITLRGGGCAGLFYGVQAFRKILPIGQFTAVEFPAARLFATPRYAYRGMHLDVCRHFFDLDFVKRYIDLLALHGINRFHWHLTDDQGWRIELLRHPQLAQRGAIRRETVIGRNSAIYDGIPYGEGCYFTQEEAREVVAYAAERHIEVIPEIDLPGHMMAALHLYPELGCTGGPYEVWCRWGVSDEVLCVGREETFDFVCEVLDEIVAIFPSKWIHIGGDECPKVRWKECPTCQQRIRQLGFDRRAGDPEEALQGWFMRRVVDYLNALGRTAIGWDEVLSSDQIGGDLVVMSWRGEAGALEAARRGIPSIMAAQNYLYFDHYQTRDNSREPLALGGFNPLDRVYGFDPRASLPDSLKGLVVGVQANLWSEYILSDAHAFHMALPRMAALSEIQWGDPAKKSYSAFMERLPRMLALYDWLEYPYAPYILEIDCHMEPDLATRTLQATLSTIDGAEIRYTLDGSQPDSHSSRYEAPITIDRSLTLQAVALRDGELSAPVPVEVLFSQATLSSAQLLTAPAPAYTFGGATTLVDALRGDRNYRTGRWIGFCGTDCILQIDLGDRKSLSEVQFRTCVNKDDGCFDARGVRIEGSVDGVYFDRIHEASYPALTEEDDHGIYSHSEHFDPVEVRYLRLTIEHERAIPAWHPYFPGAPGFLFLDEVLVY